MAESTTIARPYARAAFEEAQATGKLAEWSAALQAAAAVATEKPMPTLLAVPKLSPADKAQLVLDLCADIVSKGGMGELPEASRNFIRLLAENRRLSALPQIATIFETLRAEAEKTLSAQLISAFAISDAQRNKIAKSLKERLKRDVVLECAVDEALIGGAIIRAGDLVIDGSVRGQLAKLATALRH